MNATTHNIHNVNVTFYLVLGYQDLFSKKHFPTKYAEQKVWAIMMAEKVCHHPHIMNCHIHRVLNRHLQIFAPYECSLCCFMSLRMLTHVHCNTLNTLCTTVT